MSESNFVDLSQLYPWTHPDEFNVVLGGPVGPDSAPIITFDTYATLTELRDNDKPPFSDSPGTLPEPGKTVFVRINESYQGASARLLLYYAHGTGTTLPSGEELTKWMEIPLQNGWADTNGDGTNDSYLDSGKFEPVTNGAGEFLELEAVVVPAETLAFEGVVRENPAADNPEEPNVQDRSLSTSVAEAAAPASSQAAATSTSVAATLNPNDTSTAFGQIINTAATTLAASAATIDAAIRSLGSGPADGLADEFTALVNELNAGGLTTVRTEEIMNSLNAIAGQLPASLAATATSITSAIGPALNPGNLPGLENIARDASNLVSGLAPVAGEAMAGLTNSINFVAGATLSNLSQVAQSFSAGLRETTAILSSGNLQNLIPDVNRLFDFDPAALIKSINLGDVVNSISRLNPQDLLRDLAPNLSQIVNQMEAAFGPIGRGFATDLNAALAALRGVVDPGFGYDGARPTRDGVGVRRTARVTPEGATTPTGTPYQRLVSALNTSLTQDWQTRNSQGTPPAGQDPRGRDQIPPPPAGANPLIMEAYRISGQTEFTRDGSTGEYSWQTAFVNYILSTAGFEIVQSMSAQAYYSYGTRVNHTNPRNMQARKGDLVIFNSRTGAKYIGFFWDFNAETRKISILGGNLDGRVKVQEFPFSLRDGDFYVTHIRRGAWEPVGTVTPTTVDTTDDARAAASRAGTAGVHPTTTGPTRRGGARAWTEEDARFVEDARTFNAQFEGGTGEYRISRLTEGQRAYARARGYLR